MRIPEQVKVGPYTFAVQYEDDPRGGNDQKLMGQCDYVKQVIRLSRAIGHPDATEAIFWHELLHAIDWVMMAGLKEKQVDRMATGLTMVLRDNGLLDQGA